MGVFDDKKFESLDWISQATEPIDSELNVMLGSIPDNMVLSIEDIVSIIGASYSMSIEKESVVLYAVRQHTERKSLSWDERKILNECFSIEISGEPIVDFEKNTVTGGTLSLVKNIYTLEEKELKSILGVDGIESIKNAWYPDNCGSRFNEIFELLGKCEEGLRSRSIRKKRWALTQRVQRLMKDNEWNIKDTTLANKVGFWISSYVADGNLAALSNFCRLKVMTHKGQPIYSMEEVK